MSDWKELKTIQEVAAAQAAGEEIEVMIQFSEFYKPWDGKAWSVVYEFRSRHKKKVKTIELREALFIISTNPSRYYTSYVDSEDTLGKFICWLNTPNRIVEIEE